MTLLLLAVIYLSFISLGLPDSLLGAAWPSMYGELGVDVYLAGVLGMVLSGGTIFSSLMSTKVIRRFDTGAVTAVSVAMTAAALFGFSLSTHFWQLCIWAVLLGLGAGTVDAALNNYVALHFKSRHMNWLHCFWGVGASGGPFIMGLCLTGGLGWSAGYRTIGTFQAVLVGILILSLPLWRAQSSKAAEKVKNFNALSIMQTLKLPGAKAVMIAFFSYCAVEGATGLWASSYMALQKGIAPETAAKWGSLFYLGITAGRFLSGIISDKVGNRMMVRTGQALALIGIVIFMLPLGNTAALVALIMIGLGSGPIFPSLIHETPRNFGARNSQSVIGMQMASAYLGLTAMPPIFGALAKVTSIGVLPFFMAALSLLMIAMTELLFKSVAKHHNEGSAGGLI